MADPVTASITLSAPLIKDLWKKLRNIDIARNKELAKLSSVFGDPKALSKYYVEPNCQHHNPADSDDDVVANIRMSAFKFLSEFLSKKSDIPDGRSHCLLLADAGMGKTSLFVIFKLMHIMSFLPKKVNCDLIKLGRTSINDINRIHDPRNTILLLDALDEDPEGVLNIENRIVDLLEVTSGFKKVLISCRTQYLPEGDFSPFDHLGVLHLKGYVCPTIFLSLFEEDQVTEYLKKRFPRSQNKRLRSQKIIQSMESLRFRPLLLSFIEDLLDVDDSQLTEYHVYHRLIVAWLRREERKIRKHLKIEVSWEELLSICVEVSVFMQRGDGRDLIPEDLEALIRKNKKYKLFKKIDVGGRSLLNKNSDGAFRFSHYSIQEFLIAYSVVENKINSDDLTRSTSRVLDFLRPFNWGEIKVDALYFDDLEIKNMEIEDAILSEVSFDRAVFCDTTFSSSNFSRTRLNDCEFFRCKFTDIDFSDSSFLGARFNECKFDNCKFNESRMRKVSFEKCEILNSAIQETDLEASNFVESSLQDVDFGNSLLDYADMSKSNLIDCGFLGASTNYMKTDNALFKGNSHYTINLDSSDFSLADFED